MSTSRSLWRFLRVPVSLNSTLHLPRNRSYTTTPAFLPSFHRSPRVQSSPSLRLQTHPKPSIFHPNLLRAFTTPTATAPLSSTPSSPPPPPPKRDFRSLSREYGPIALGVYLTLSFITFCGCFISITVLGIDSAQIRAALDYVKAKLGFHVPTPEERAAEDSEDKEESRKWVTYLPEWAREPAVLTTSRNVLLAMAMTKLFMPIKLGITAAVTPAVAKKLRNLGFNLGQKGGYKAAAADARERVQAKVAERAARKAARSD
ncbi:hypothetical protein HK104_005515 [Borealophlyctis nickersoniae]|nr:hypothetical protein HK104_005515 [Borealophlyctis nickersoniae]